MRQLSPYEQNRLRRHGIDPETIGQYGEMPVEYINGFSEFYDREFVVNPHVMIPRIETEGIVRIALAELSARRTANGERRIIRLADVGTGCGCLGITLYKELSAFRPSVMSSGLRLRGRSGVRLFELFESEDSSESERPEGFSEPEWPEDSVPSTVKSSGLNSPRDSRRSNDFPLIAYLSDISEDALDVARKNVDRLVPKPHHIHLLRSDLLTNYERRTSFDLIVANLPYIPSSRIPKLQPSVRDYEPLLALDGGPDGLTVIKKFLEQVPHFLKKDGKIVLEVDETHRPRQLDKEERFSINVHPDSFGKNRFCVFTLR